MSAEEHECRRLLIKAAARRGRAIDISTEPPLPLLPPAVRFTCPHGIHYWIAPAGQVDVFGLRLNVEPRADFAARIAAGGSASFIVMRCADMPSDEIPAQLRARNTIVGCTDCKEPCWLDPQAYVPGTVIRCLRCLEHMPGPYQPHTTSEAVEEVRRLLEEDE